MLAMVSHSKLIQIGQSLGYTSITEEGLCRGYSAMWMQANCIGDLRSFKARMKVIAKYADTPMELVRDLKAVQEKVKSEEGLTDSEKVLSEIPVFFEGIALYLNPQHYSQKEYSALFDNVDGKSKLLLQHNTADISALVQSTGLEEKGGVCRNLYGVNEYKQSQLKDYLDKMSEQLKNRSDVSVLLGANRHSIAVRVLSNGNFQLLDTNHLNLTEQEFTSEQLATQLATGFSHQFGDDKPPLLLSTEIYTSGNNQLTPEIVTALTPTEDEQSLSLNVLGTALMKDVQSVIARFDLSKIDPLELTERVSLLAYACANGNEKTIDSLLNHKNFKAADTVSEDSDFPPAIMSAVGQNNLELVEKLYTKGVDPSHRIRALSVAVMEKQTDIIDYFLTREDIDLTVQVQKGQPLMCAAVISGDFELAKKLIDKGVLCNQRPPNNWSPLHIACAKDDVGMVRLLLDNKADLTINSGGQTPLLIALNRKPQQQEIIDLLTSKMRSNSAKEYREIIDFRKALQDSPEFSKAGQGWFGLSVEPEHIGKFRSAKTIKELKDVAQSALGPKGINAEKPPKRDEKVHALYKAILSNEVRTFSDAIACLNGIKGTAPEPSPPSPSPHSFIR